MKEELISAIRKYLRDSYAIIAPLGPTILRSQYFDQIVYENWARKELMIHIKNSKAPTVTMAVEEFAAKMDEFACMDSKYGFGFSVAYDLAMDVLDEIRRYEKQNLFNERRLNR